MGSNRTKLVLSPEELFEMIITADQDRMRMSMAEHMKQFGYHAGSSISKSDLWAAITLAFGITIEVSDGQ